MIAMQGQRATTAGKAFEQQIAAQLRAKGVDFTEQVRLANGSIFGGVKVIDFLIHNLEEYPHGVYLEAKWQDSLGSAEEKIVFSIACIKETYDKPSILVLDGDGFKKGVIPWVERQQGGYLIKVLSGGDLTKWLMRNTFTQ